MIQIKFNPMLPLLWVFYGRMSSKLQNERSPEQQYETCTNEIKRREYPWRQVGSYIDRAKSGRFKRKRPEFMRMIQDIRTHKIKVDLIVVDTLERFGRADEFDALRRELRDQYGVLIVTADTNFADPTSPTGKVFTVIENLRTTEDSRIKAHNVLRGKRDCVKSKHWPGGRARLVFVFRT